MIAETYSRMADAIVLTSGWRRRGVAFLAGAIGALAMPPFGILPALLVPMTVAVWLIDGAVGTRRSRSLVEAARIGWWLGFGFFIAGLWWLGAAFLVEAEEFAWALPLGVVGLPAVLALFTAAGFALARLLWSAGPGRVFALAAGLGLSEWLRGFVLTGFPWNNFGMALGDHLLLAQAASVIGLHGLTFVAIAIAAAPALAAGKVRRPLLPVLASLLCLGVLTGFGTVRLLGSETRLHEDVRLRIMQPNLPQDAKFRADAIPEILARYLRLSDATSALAPGGAAGVTHLIWPESPFPVILSRRPDVLQQIGDFLPPQTFLITGAAREETGGGQGASRFFNSILVIRSGGEVVDQYDKVHLVPFGEYLPFRALFDALRIRQFVHIPGGFEAGERRTLLRAPGLPAAAPLVCYEAIFPGAVVPSHVMERPSLLLNVTNDGWFGNTPGPRQHFAQARLRAIEEGLPLIRAANTGVSAIVDPFGRVVASLPVGVEGVLDGGLPLPSEATLFSRFPFVMPAIIWFLALLGALIFRRPDAAHG